MQHQQCRSFSSSVSSVASRLLATPYKYSAIWDASVLSPDETIALLRRVSAFSHRGSGINHVLNGKKKQGLHPFKSKSSPCDSLCVNKPHFNMGYINSNYTNGRFGNTGRSGAESINGNGLLNNLSGSFASGSSSMNTYASNLSHGSGGSTFDAAYMKPDSRILALLSKRFYESCERYYPPQILEIAELFADIGYLDQNVVKGFVGRLDDLLANASERRLLQILNLGYKLRINPSEWWNTSLNESRTMGGRSMTSTGLAVSIQDKFQNLQHGIPNALEALLFVFSDPSTTNPMNSSRSSSSEDGTEDGVGDIDDSLLPEVFVDALATQLLINRESLGAAVFARGFEKLSLHRYDYPEVMEIAIEMLVENANKTPNQDTKILLTHLVTGFQRYMSKDGSLEAVIGSDYSKIKSICKSAPLLDLKFASKLGTVVSETQLAEMVDQLELQIADTKFVRFELPEKLHELARVSCRGGESSEPNIGVKFLTQVLQNQFSDINITSGSISNSLSKYSAKQLLDLGETAAMVSATSSNNECVEVLKSLRLTSLYSTLEKSLKLLSPQLDLIDQRRFVKLQWSDLAIASSLKKTSVTQSYQEKRRTPRVTPFFPAAYSPAFPVPLDAELRNVFGESLLLTNEDTLVGVLTWKDRFSNGELKPLAKLMQDACKNVGKDVEWINA